MTINTGNTIKCCTLLQIFEMSVIKLLLDFDD